MISCVSNMRTSSSPHFVYNIPAKRKNLRSRQKQRLDDEDDYVSRSSTTTGQSEFSSSPKVPAPSQAFSSVLCKLRFSATAPNAARSRRNSYVSSDDELVATRSCGAGILTNNRKSCPSRIYPSSCQSAPASSSNTPKQRRTVRFDEATITSTAEFGETAARFRNLSRNKKRCASAAPLRTTSATSEQQLRACFGGSRNIIMLHEDDSDVLGDFKRMSFTATAPPTKAAAHGKNPRSIFDVCDVFTYTGRFT